ncbi:phosphatidylinositol-glycan biosynthesis class F protein isoform X1 [Gracilinanus agilis]|uniref:phosphatidylinositol-glycan biosynthesis class F protein isoform X1 n=1 Tax=Gracilinanus agilis TaxID=191870 RepID=UPI001CFEAB20|nr:phosphatidylinositol-glycan biosynthesis class F protein isoform X1 [Gracilinanus agilis]
MKDADIKRLFYVHIFCIISIVLTTFIPSFFLEDFSVLETHLTWLCICSICVAIINVVLYLQVKPNPSSKRSSIFHKISRLLKSCVYFFISCLLFHAIIVLYGAPLIELMLETFLFAVILSTFTTLPCLCLLGPNIKAWLRVFTKNGASSIWDNSLQITTMSSVIGAWLGAFPIPLDWERPWQKEESRTVDGSYKETNVLVVRKNFLMLPGEVWPISCTLGATFGYMAGLLISPVWIYRNRKQLTYKSR